MRLIFVRIRVGWLAIVAATAVAACGGSSSEEARKLHFRSVIETVKPVPQFVVTRSAIAATRPDSVEYALLTHWRNLQFRAWSAAARQYEPGLQGFIGFDLLTRALMTQASTYRASRPQHITTTRRGDGVRVRFVRHGADEVTPATMSWQRTRAGHWLISYDSLLDQALAEARQSETQQRLDPLSQRLLPAAIQAGIRARSIQSEYAARRAAGNAARP